MWSKGRVFDEISVSSSKQRTIRYILILNITITKRGKYNNLQIIFVVSRIIFFPLSTNSHRFLGMTVPLVINRVRVTQKRRAVITMECLVMSPY